MLPNQNLGEALVDLLKQEAVAEGKTLVNDLKSVATYAASEISALAKVVGEPGYRDALIATRDNIVLQAAGRAVESADVFDAKIAGLVQGALHLAVMAV